MGRTPKKPAVREAPAVYDAGIAERSAPLEIAGRVVLGGQRRVVLPSDVTGHLGVELGDRIVYFLEPDGSVRLRSARDVARSFVGMFAGLKKDPDRSVVDDFIAARRAEARRDESGR